MEKLTVTDLVHLDRYTNDLAHELDGMSKRADRNDKPILIEKSNYFKRKNMHVQKLLMKILDEFE
jgi:hypothetical protein